MFARFADEPGLLYVVATLLPLASFALLLLAGGLRNLGRARRDSTWGSALFQLAGGDKPGPGGAYLATAAIACSCVLSLVGLVRFLSEHPVPLAAAHEAPHAAASEAGPVHAAETPKAPAAHHDGAAAPFPGHPAPRAVWQDRLTWVQLSANGPTANRPAFRLEVGYAIDHLAAVMFAMVTFIATLIHIFALGYMAEEKQETVVDHDVHLHAGGHLHRRGRYNRFFLYFSLFCFAMLNLVLADNLFQVFVSWELVGICSYLLIGFYYERHRASNAANKAFITNRVGDAGFILGLMILWTHVGTFNFQEVFARVRSPRVDAHGALAQGGQFVRLDPVGAPDADGVQMMAWRPPGQGGSQAALFPLLKKNAHYHGFGPGEDHVSELGIFPDAGLDDPSAMPYWMLVLAGVGIFLGCVGKSAQFPLQVWLPDAMEGPTPVSALVHSATMVAAGVYLVGRCFPLFTPEVQLIIAYTGAITLFVAATIAVVATDIKKVLAYSTISQLGFMMLALGIGGWIAGLLHLITHAFFKALLFLGSGSVIHGCHHEQDLRRMGGLVGRMPVTAATMLVGVLAIAGTPLFSGWYSKDAMLAAALGNALAHPRHALLLILPLLTAGLTCFYMFRLWFLAFTGQPRDHHVFEHAHESPRVMTVPLVILAAFSVFVAWGVPIWSPEASYLGAVLGAAQPASVTADFGTTLAVAHARMPDYHNFAGWLALNAAFVGAAFAFLAYVRHAFRPAETAAQFPRLYRFLQDKWGFDDLYRVGVVRPALAVAGACRWFDRAVIDRLIDGTARAAIRVARWDGMFDAGVVDGLVNRTAQSIYAVGTGLRAVQTGLLRNYLMFLVLAALALFAVLGWCVGLSPAR